MKKDIFKSLNSIHKDSNLTLEEKHLLTILIKYHNVIDGYSYPTYEFLLSECSTSRRSKISKMIKGLKEKGYIEVSKVKGNKSHYYIKKHLFFIEKIDYDKKENSTDKDNLEIPVEEKVKTKDNAINPIIVSDCKESGVQITIDDVEEVKVKQHPNNSKIAKAFEKSKTFKLSKWLLDRVAYIDETIVDIVLEEKPKTAKLFLIKCIEKTLLAGLELAPIIKNTLNFYSKKDIDYASAMTTQYSSKFYMTYAEKQLGLI